MMVDTTIYGYATSDGVFHPQCYADGSTEHAAGTVSALYYLDDEDPHGMTCDACYEYIFEPVERHVFRPENKYDGSIDPNGHCYECQSWQYCGEDEACELHETDDANDPGERGATTFEGWQ